MDWDQKSAEEIHKKVLAKVGAGSIVLFHSGVQATLEALPGILVALTEKGYTFLPADEMIYKGSRIFDQQECQYPET